MLSKIYMRLFGKERKANKLFNKMLRSKVKIRKTILKNKLEKKYNIYIGPNVIIGNNLRLNHVDNIHFGNETIIGDNVILYHNITFGQKNGKYPKIGNNVTIFPNAMLIGDISIGDNVIVGAGSIVTKSFPDNVVIGGNPAKILKMIK